MSDADRSILRHFLADSDWVHGWIWYRPSLGCSQTIERLPKLYRGEGEMTTFKQWLVQLLVIGAISASWYWLGYKAGKHAADKGSAEHPTSAIGTIDITDWPVGSCAGWIGTTLVPVPCTFENRLDADPQYKLFYNYHGTP